MHHPSLLIRVIYLEQGFAVAETNPVILDFFLYFYRSFSRRKVFVIELAPCLKPLRLLPALDGTFQ